MSSPADLQSLYGRVTGDLERVEALIQESLHATEPAVARMADHASGRGGKRMRPAMALLVADAAGQRRPIHRQLGAVVEMIHLATLVHDDVIDGASIRRARGTVNALWSNHDAVLLGDIIFARAIHLLARMGDQKSLLDLTVAVSRLCEGEILQNSRRGDVELDEDTYYKVIDQKTAELYRSGCELAAHLAGADADRTQAFGTFGRELGHAFQIIDDCLDLSGEEDVVGKSLGTDLGGGKMTLPLIFLRERSPTEGAECLREVVGQGSSDAAQWSRINELLEETGALVSARERALTHVQTALDAVQAHVDADAFSILGAIGAFVASRVD